MRSRHAALLSLWTAACILAIPRPGSSAVADDDEGEEADRREQLTEREDKRRPLEPWGFDVLGHPLTFGGEFEFELDGLRQRIIGEDVDEHDRLLIESGLELEAFYSLGPVLSFFAQGRLTLEEDLLPDTPESVSSVFLERGEMWLISENILGSHMNFEIGRLDYEDERRWWWDDELDSFRISYERESFDIALALARELFPERTDTGTVDSELEDVNRLIGEAGWEYHENHALELFLLGQDDRSPQEQQGEVVPRNREDESDARLLWLGARALGFFDLPAGWSLGYWLDTGIVGGDERLYEFDEQEVEQVVHRDVRGYGFDVGVSAFAPLWSEPRVFGSYAFGSGDRSPNKGSDLSYRQSGIQANESGFGGVERYGNYGIVLDPELSNLGVATAGVGITLLDASSLDLVYHYTRQVQPAKALPDTRIEAELTGRDREIGHEIDLVLALEEWERFEFFVLAGAFRAGEAFGDDRGTWSYGGLFATRFAF